MKHKIIAAAAISAVMGLMSLALSAKESYIGTDSTIVVRDYIANMEYVNGVLERVNFEGGYIDMTGESPRYMYYVTDHLGNVRAVVDEDGNVCQVNHYYPYGDRFEDTRDIPVEESDNTKLFGGKEYSEDTGLHDFEARYDNTLFGRFTTLDPMAEKYYSVSPYAYCAGNPVNRVDPSGKDIWEIDKDGYIVNRRIDDTQDAFYIIDGEIDPSRKIVFNPNTFSENNGLFSSSDGKSSIDLFGFLASNSGVEYGLIATYEKQYAVFSDNQTNKIDMVRVGRGLENLGYTISVMMHSHPNNTKPSGFESKEFGDRMVAMLYDDPFSREIEHFVYIPKYDSVIQFTKKNVYDELIPLEIAFPHFTR